MSIHREKIKRFILDGEDISYKVRGVVVAGEAGKPVEVTFRVAAASVEVSGGVVRVTTVQKVIADKRLNPTEGMG